MEHPRVGLALFRSCDVPVRAERAEHEASQLRQQAADHQTEIKVASGHRKAAQESAAKAWAERDALIKSGERLRVRFELSEKEHRRATAQLTQDLLDAKQKLAILSETSMQVTEAAKDAELVRASRIMRAPYYFISSCLNINLFLG